MFILGLRLIGGSVQPIARCKRSVSNRELKTILKKFKRDSDVVGFVCLEWRRLYNTKRDSYGLPEMVSSK
jgi:hypothetical protein